MRGIEILAGLFLALVVFVVLKVIGLVLKFALLAAVFGYIVGHLAARAVRGSSV